MSDAPAVRAPPHQAGHDLPSVCLSFLFPGGSVISYQPKQSTRWPTSPSRTGRKVTGPCQGGRWGWFPRRRWGRCGEPQAWGPAAAARLVLRVLYGSAESFVHDLGATAEMGPERRVGVMLSSGEGWAREFPVPTVLPCGLQTATARQKPRTLMMNPLGMDVTQ